MFIGFNYGFESCLSSIITLSGTVYITSGVFESESDLSNPTFFLVFIVSKTYFVSIGDYSGVYSVGMELILCFTVLKELTVFNLAMGSATMRPSSKTASSSLLSSTCKLFSSSNI